MKASKIAIIYMVLAAMMLCIQLFLTEEIIMKQIMFITVLVLLVLAYCAQLEQKIDWIIKKLE